MAQHGILNSGLNSSIELPKSYESLDQTLKTADLILSDAVSNATTLFHTPVVSSFDGKRNNIKSNGFKRI